VTDEVEEKHYNGHPRFLVERYTNLHTLVLQYVFSFKRLDSCINFVLSPNNTFNIFLNGDLEKTGNLLEDMEPSINPPTEIDDPTDSKPLDWVEEDRIIDVNATKVSTGTLFRCSVLIYFNLA
jgi:hypothetical protein